MKGIIKANTVDKYLRPVRLQIIELVEPNTTLIELGCGNGDLLFKVSHKLRFGLGIDKSKSLIAYASDRLNREAIRNLNFKLGDLLNDTFSESEMDYSVASLLLHILPLDKAKEILEKLIVCSKTTIICGFSEPQNMKQELLLWFDQRFTGHYSNFLDYKNNGFTEGLLNSVEGINYRKIDTFDPVIKIYKITKHHKS